MKWQILIVELSVANKKGILWMQKQYMIIDLEKRGDKRMFITEQVSSIYKNKNGLWTVQFLSSPRVFNYNQSRLSISLILNSLTLTKRIVHPKQAYH